MSDQEAAIVAQDEAVRESLVKKFLEDVVLVQLRQLIEWQSVTGQSSQVDSGYLAQQLVSLLTGVPGSGHRGKGEDLIDGSEVKAASAIGGVDIPRWNNSLTKDDAISKYLSRGRIFFVLFDTAKRLALGACPVPSQLTARSADRRPLCRRNVGSGTG